jgi:hypothetical protein
MHDYTSNEDTYEVIRRTVTWGVTLSTIDNNQRGFPSSSDSIHEYSSKKMKNQKKVKKNKG